MTPSFLSVKECMRQLGCSKDYIYALIHKRLVSFIPMGNRFRIDQASWENYLAKCRIPGSHHQPSEKR